MYVKKDNAENLFERTEQKYLDMKINELVGIDLVDNFVEVLDDIAQKSKYNEGDKIKENDLSRISVAVTRILSTINDNIVKTSSNLVPALRAKSESFSYMMAANDYLFSMTMRVLGSPDMPPAFGDQVKNSTYSLAKDSEFQIRKRDYEIIEGDNRFNKQRKKNADKVTKELKNLTKNIRSGKATTLEIAKYVAEYQALKKRQEQHTSLWRFFHRDENKKRTELLGNMKELLGTVVKDGLDVDTNTPLQIAEGLNNKHVNGLMEEAFKDTALCDRFKYTHSAFRYEANNENVISDVPTNDNPAIENEVRQSVNLDINEIEATESKTEISSQKEFKEPVISNTTLSK